jgi:hypothetical protein
MKYEMARKTEQMMELVVSRPWNQLIDTVWNRQYIPGDEKLIKTIGIIQLIFKLGLDLVEQQTHLVKTSSLN